MDRSLKLSPDGKQQVERAITAKPWRIAELTEAVNLGEATVKKFLAGGSIDRKNFVNLCIALELPWEEVKDPPERRIAVQPLGSSVQPSMSDDWVEQVRRRCCKKILHQHSRIQLLNQTEVGVDELYVDVWLLNRSPRTYQVSGSTLVKSFDLRNDRLGLGDRISAMKGWQLPMTTQNC